MSIPHCKAADALAQWEHRGRQSSHDGPPAHHSARWSPVCSHRAFLPYITPRSWDRLSCRLALVSCKSPISLFITGINMRARCRLIHSSRHRPWPISIHHLNFAGKCTSFFPVSHAPHSYNQTFSCCWTCGRGVLNGLRNCSHVVLINPDPNIVANFHIRWSHFLLFQTWCIIMFLTWFPVLSLSPCYKSVVSSYQR